MLNRAIVTKNSQTSTIVHLLFMWGMSKTWVIKCFNHTQGCKFNFPLLVFEHFVNLVYMKLLLWTTALQKLFKSLACTSLLQDWKCFSISHAVKPLMNFQLWNKFHPLENTYLVGKNKLSPKGNHYRNLSKVS